MQALIALTTNEMDVDNVDDSDSDNRVIRQEEIIENMQKDDEEAVEIPAGMLKNTVDRKKYQSVEENIAEQMGTSGPERCTARCTLKLPYTSSKDSAAYCVKALKSFFKKARKLGDKKVFLAP